MGQLTETLFNLIHCELYKLTNLFVVLKIDFFHDFSGIVGGYHINIVLLKSCLIAFLHEIYIIME